MWPWSTQRKLDQILAQQAVIIAKQNHVLLAQENALKETRSRFDAIDATLRDILLRCSNPGPLRLVITGEDPMADKILFQVVLPPKSAADVVRRELLVSFADGTEDLIELTASDTVTENLKGDQDSDVTLSLVDIDDAGNRSEPSVATFTLQDTVAPPQPGELGIKITGEEVADGSEG